MPAPPPPLAPPVPAPPDGEVGVPPAAADGELVVGAAAPLVPLGAEGPAAVEAVEEVLLEDWLELVAAAAAVAEDAAGTVNEGAPLVSVPVEPAVPQAATPIAITAAAARTAGRGLLVGGCIRRVPRMLRSPAAPCACRSRGSR